VKIIGGTCRGRLLKTPKGEKTRPTLAILRKAVFDILHTHVEGAHILDLYAGSGAMGLEGLSRGAHHATFVETDRNAFRCIEENTRLLGLQDQCTLLSYDVLLALKKMAKESHQYDIIYVDPPYAPAAKHHLLQDILLFLDTHPLLRPEGRLFLEEATPPTLNVHALSLSQLIHVDTRTFSRSALHQFRMKSD
jgi:16S rRNA (guanine966-N2)-methyltransferase